MRDRLVPEVVEPLLAGRFGKPYIYAERCESTQKLLDPSLPEGAAAVCEEQTAGRGRLGRRWEAPLGRAILCSVLVRPRPERRAAELSLVGGLAAALAVERATGRATELKWPNDVMLAGRKVAGVLAEAKDGAVVVGIGLNVNQTAEELPADGRVPAGSLLAVDGTRRDRAPLLAALLAELERAYAAWTPRGLASLYEDLAARDFLRGRNVSVAGEAGVAVGIDRGGRLVIEVDGERRVVESGEVLYER